MLPVGKDSPIRDYSWHSQDATDDPGAPPRRHPRQGWQLDNRQLSQARERGNEGRSEGVKGEKRPVTQVLLISHLVSLSDIG